MRIARVKTLSNLCTNCGFCYTVFKCKSISECVGCLGCFYACPNEAKVIEYIDKEPKYIKIVIDGKEFQVPRGITVRKALELLNFEFSPPGTSGISIACGTGGCWSCAVIINGELKQSCITPIKDNMVISTDVKNLEPLRIVHGPEPHTVGGKATPWWEVNYIDYVEAAIWVAGCNLRCPQCQNYHVTYDNTTPPLTPREAARKVVACHEIYRTKGIAISGGEPTLNRRWLIEFFKEVTKLVKPKIRRHLDSNGTLLTPDYIDDLVQAGCNNIGIEPKCVEASTYMKITGLKDPELAKKYLDTAWRAIKYCYENYQDKVYLGIGLVYNKDLVSLEEIAKAGEKIVSIDPNIQVTVLDYFPTFRRRWLKRPTVKEMLRVKEVLESQGLKCVIVQTRIGHIGPGDIKRP